MGDEFILIGPDVSPYVTFARAERICELAGSVQEIVPRQTGWS